MKKYKYIYTIVTFFLLSATMGYAQKETIATDNTGKTIEGLVRDAQTKQPVSAAQITISSKKASAVSDENGKFTIQVLTDDDVLHVTAYDYSKREIPVQGKTQLTIDLYTEGFSNYYKQIENASGKSIDNTWLTTSSKEAGNLTQQPILTADDVLQTSLGSDVRAITHSGTVGVGSSLFIRGLNSLNANTQPLFVVDGVIWNNYNEVESIHQGFYSNILDYIDVNDIENITVLKDGMSIYGTKAANGVILIQTKRAKSMVTKIRLSIFSGLTTTPGKLPMMDGESFRIYASDLQRTGLSTTVDKSFLGDPSDVNYNQYNNNTDWSKQIYQTGSTSNIMINVDGGDEKALYYFSVGYTGNNGVVKNTDFQRINSRFNVDAKLAKIVNMGVNIGFTRTDRDLLDDGMNPYTSPTWQSVIKSPFLSPNRFTNGVESKTLAHTDIFGVGNPVGLIDYSKNTLMKYRFNVGFTPEVQILPTLKIWDQFDYSIDKTVEAFFQPVDFTPARYLENKGIAYNKLASQTIKNTAYYNDFRIIFEKGFGLNSLNAMYGFRYIQNDFESDYIEEYNSGNNNSRVITGNRSFLYVDGVNNLTKSLANYVNVEYDYNKKYFVTGTVSMDASSRFGDDVDGGISLFGTTWALFPSVNAAWLFSSEKFMRNIKPVSFGKIRLGYGLTGNDGIPDYESYAYLASVRYMGKGNGLIISHFENNKIQWELTKKANAGIDLGLFNDRLMVSFDVFKSNTDNLLVLKDLPDISGSEKYWANGGEMENRGYELSVNSKLLNLKDFKWEFGFSVGHYKNKITALPDGEEYYLTEVYDGEIITKVGQPANLFYGYKTNGVYATGQQALDANLYTQVTADGQFARFEAGDVIFVNKNNDNIIDENDKQIIGDPNPDIYGTITSKWIYKRFTLNTTFTYSYGNDVYNYYRSQLESGKNFNNQTKSMNNRWIADGQVTNQPKSVWGDPMGNSRFSDRWIEDGSYIKLKQVMLSYQIPLKNDFIRGINVWASANNLVTLTKYLGLDPEFSVNNSIYYQGIDTGLLPSTRSYYLGVKIDL